MNQHKTYMKQKQAYLPMEFLADSLTLPPRNGTFSNMIDLVEKRFKLCTQQKTHYSIANM